MSIASGLPWVSWDPALTSAHRIVVLCQGGRTLGLLNACLPICEWDLILVKHLRLQLCRGITAKFLRMAGFGLSGSAS